MNKDEIKKGLECCVKHVYCKGCPYRGNQQCISKTQQDALALITEQEKEIERLRTTLGQCNTELNSALESLKSQCREIGKLKAEVKQAKIEVLNELKTRHDYATKNMGYPWDISQEIDELIKEVENDK